METEGVRKKLEHRDSDSLKELYQLYSIVYNVLAKLNDVTFSTFGLMNILANDGKRYDAKEVQIVLDIICELHERIELLKVVKWFGIYYKKFDILSQKKDQYDFITEIRSLQKLLAN